jgi:hypothetical protein
MSDEGRAEHVDAVAKAAAQGLSRRRVLRLFLVSGAAAQASPGCATVLSLQASLGSIPFIGAIAGPILNAVAAALGCNISDAGPVPTTTTPTTVATTTTTTAPKSCLCSGNPGPPNANLCLNAGDVLVVRAVGYCSKTSFPYVCFTPGCVTTHTYTCNAGLVPILTGFTDDCP